eukprot:2559018-Pleurochrysis_carterae.AAC.2
MPFRASGVRRDAELGVDVGVGADCADVNGAGVGLDSGVAAGACGTLGEGKTAAADSCAGAGNGAAAGVDGTSAAGAGTEATAAVGVCALGWGTVTATVCFCDIGRGPSSKRSQRVLGYDDEGEVDANEEHDERYGYGYQCCFGKHTCVICTMRRTMEKRRARRVREKAAILTN